MKNRQFIVLCILIIVGFSILYYQNDRNHKDTVNRVNTVISTTTDQYSIIVKNIDNLKAR